MDKIKTRPREEIESDLGTALNKSQYGNMFALLVEVALDIRELMEARNEQR